MPAMLIVAWRSWPQNWKIFSAKTQSGLAHFLSSCPARVGLPNLLSNIEQAQFCPFDLMSLTSQLFFEALCYCRVWPFIFLSSRHKKLSGSSIKPESQYNFDLRFNKSLPGGDDRRRLHGGLRSACAQRRPARRRDRLHGAHAAE